MKALIFVSVIIAIFIGSSLFGAILADKKSGGKDYFKRILLPVFIAAPFLALFEVGWFIERFGCSLFEDLSQISFNNGIFIPFLFAFILSFLLLFFYRIRNINEKNLEEFGFLLLPSFIGVLLSSVPIIEMMINL